jgi:CDP-diglyceride synthetase
MRPPDPLISSLFLIVAFVLAGFLQTFWFRSSLSKRLMIPIDGGRTFRGRRIFGDNKTWRGFIGMIPAVGVVFIALRLLLEHFSPRLLSELWPLSTRQYGLLGGWVGFGFMAGELPNSFFKRRLCVQPGDAPVRPKARTVGFIVDRTDSIVGALMALAIMVPLPLTTCLVILLVGPLFHWAFSLLLFQLGVKARPA